MTRLLVTAHGADRPGIVAAVTAALAANDCNLEDTSMTRLGGHFTMLLLVESRRPVTIDDVPQLFSEVQGFENLEINVSFPDDEPVAPMASEGGERWAISLYGADQQGIVATITGYLAEMGVNIIDLSTRLTGDPKAPVYTMLIDAEMPPGIEGGDISIQLDQRAHSLGITCHARPVDVDTF